MSTENWESISIAFRKIENKTREKQWQVTNQPAYV